MKQNKITRKDWDVFADIGKILGEHFYISSLARNRNELLVDEIARNFGEYLKATRLMHGYQTRLELAIEAGLPEAEIVALEHGLILYNQIKFESLQALAEVLDEDIETFALLLEREDILAATSTRFLERISRGCRAILTAWGRGRMLLIVLVMVITFVIAVCVATGISLSRLVTLPELLDVDNQLMLGVVAPQAIKFVSVPWKLAKGLPEPLNRHRFRLALINALLLLAFWWAIWKRHIGSWMKPEQRLLLVQVTVVATLICTLIIDRTPAFGSQLAIGDNSYLRDEYTSTFSPHTNLVEVGAPSSMLFEDDYAQLNEQLKVGVRFDNVPYTVQMWEGENSSYMWRVLVATEGNTELQTETTLEFAHRWPEVSLTPKGTLKIKREMDQVWVLDVSLVPSSNDDNDDSYGDEVVSISSMPSSSNDDNDGDGVVSHLVGLGDVGDDEELDVVVGNPTLDTTSQREIGGGGLLAQTSTPPLLPPPHNLPPTQALPPTPTAVVPETVYRSRPDLLTRLLANSYVAVISILYVIMLRITIRDGKIKQALDKLAKRRSRESEDLD